MAHQGSGHAAVERDGQVGGLRAALLMAHQGGGHAAGLSSPVTLSGDGQADYGGLTVKLPTNDGDHGLRLNFHKFEDLIENIATYKVV
jgi:hypothetical protein